MCLKYGIIILTEVPLGQILAVSLPQFHTGIYNVCIPMTFPLIFVQGVFKEKQTTFISKIKKTIAVMNVSINIFIMAQPYAKPSLQYHI